MYEAKHRIITNESVKYAEKLIQVMSLFRAVPWIKVRSSVAAFSHRTKFNSQLQFAHSVFP
jgi:hypothetical protein